MVLHHIRFPLGRIVITPGAAKALSDSNLQALALLRRHQTGDWGIVPPEDAKENELSLREGFRIISSYNVADTKVWIITEANRSLTTILLPSEY